MGKYGFLETKQLLRRTSGKRSGEHLEKDLGKILTQLNPPILIFIWTHKKRQDRDTRRNDSGMKNKKRTNDH